MHAQSVVLSSVIVVLKREFWTKKFGRAKMCRNIKGVVLTSVVLTRLDCIYVQECFFLRLFYFELCIFIYFMVENIMKCFLNLEAKNPIIL
jgi:hypothetical protein